MGVSFGIGVKVSDGMAEAVSVGMGVKVSVATRLGNVDSALGAGEAGACPVLLKLQASVVRVKIMGRKSFLLCTA